MREHVREARPEQVLATGPVDAAGGLRHAHHAVAEAGAPRRVEARGRQHPDRRDGSPQCGNKRFQLALDVGEGDRTRALLQRVQRAGVEQREKFQPLFGIVLGSANTAQRPSLERTHIEAVEHAPGLLQQEAYGFRRRLGNALDDAKPLGEVLRAGEPARGNRRRNQQRQRRVVAGKRGKFRRQLRQRHNRLRAGGRSDRRRITDKSDGGVAADAGGNTAAGADPLVQQRGRQTGPRLAPYQFKRAGNLGLVGKRCDQGLLLFGQACRHRP